MRRRRSLTEEAGDPDEAEQAVESPPGSRQSVTLQIGQRDDRHIVSRQHRQQVTQEQATAHVPADTAVVSSANYKTTRWISLWTYSALNPTAAD